MADTLNQNWDQSKIIDDLDFDSQEAEEFKTLLGSPEKSLEEGGIATMETKQILKGRIVEISKDFVVVDVGLKSEGLVPISEFDDPSALTLEAEIEVYLDQAEGEDGQIVLSRDKARRQRQWEYIVNNCEEGSIVEG